MIAAAISMRKITSQSGVRLGCSSSGSTPINRRSGGKVTLLGGGGVARSSHQITGRVRRPRSASGAAKAMGPRLST